MPAERKFLPGRHVIEGYGAGGFRFADMSHQGSILVLPSGIEAWPVVRVADLTEADFDAIFEHASDIQLFLLGCGKDPAFVPPVVRRRFEEAGIGFDAMPTAAAARTYNVLVAEDRRVAAALIAVA
ncbi:MAG: hypothetical protein K2P80_08820 [Beijerinckiaceae bacterium]|nr:hypothetical protein [Beijerinckiaceae bacterium]